MRALLCLGRPAVLLAVFAVLFFLPRPAAAVPVQVPYSGQLAEDGELVNGNRTMRFMIVSEGPFTSETLVLTNGPFFEFLNGEPAINVYTASVPLRVMIAGDDIPPGVTASVSAVFEGSAVKLADTSVVNYGFGIRAGDFLVVRFDSNSIALGADITDDGMMDSVQLNTGVMNITDSMLLGSPAPGLVSFVHEFDMSLSITVNPTFRFLLHGTLMTTESVLYSPTPAVPEPSTLTLLCSALAMLVGLHAARAFSRRSPA